MFSSHINSFWHWFVNHLLVSLFRLLLGREEILVKSWQQRRFGAGSYSPPCFNGCEDVHHTDPWPGERKLDLIKISQDTVLVTLADVTQRDQGLSKEKSVTKWTSVLDREQQEAVVIVDSFRY